MFFPNNVPKTKAKTIVVSSGSNNVHTNPKYERLYFNLIPFTTNSFKRYLYLINPSAILHLSMPV